MKNLLYLLLVFSLILAFGISALKHEEQLKTVEPEKPEIPQEPRIIVIHNSTVIRKYDEFFYAPPATAFTVYYIVLEETTTNLLGQKKNVRIRVPYTAYKLVQVGDRYIEWKYEGWFQKHHHEIWRNGTCLVEW